MKYNILSMISYIVIACLVASAVQASNEDEKEPPVKSVIPAFGASSSSRSTLENLPSELWMHIILFLSDRELLVAGRADKLFFSCQNQELKDRGLKNGYYPSNYIDHPSEEKFYRNYYFANKAFQQGFHAALKNKRYLDKGEVLDSLLVQQQKERLNKATSFMLHFYPQSIGYQFLTALSNQDYQAIAKEVIKDYGSRVTPGQTLFNPADVLKEGIPSWQVLSLMLIDGRLGINQDIKAARTILDKQKAHLLSLPWLHLRIEELKNKLEPMVNSFPVDIELFKENESTLEKLMEIDPTIIVDDLRYVANIYERAYREENDSVKKLGYLLKYIIAKEKILPYSPQNLENMRDIRDAYYQAFTMTKNNKSNLNWLQYFKNSLLMSMDIIKNNNSSQEDKNTSTNLMVFFNAIKDSYSKEAESQLQMQKPYKV